PASKYRSDIESSPTQQKREALAHAFGTFLSQKSVRDEIEGKDPALWQKIVDAIVKFFQGKEMPEVVRDAIRGLRDRRASLAQQTQAKSEEAKPEQPKKKLGQKKAKAKTLAEISEDDLAADIQKELEAQAAQ